MKNLDPMIESAADKAMQRACAELPLGYGISISLERDAGTVEWIDPDGNEFHIEGEGYMSDDISEAIEAAKLAAATVAPVPRMGGNTKPESSPIAEPDTATQAPSASLEGSELFDLIRAWTATPEGKRSKAARDIIDFIYSWHRRATQAAKPLTPADIDDMAFGYVPSGKIGELREFARAIELHLKGE